MRIIGIDPGIGRTGWGIIEAQNLKCKVVSYGCIETQSSISLPERLSILFNNLQQIITKENPQTLAIEELFFNTNAKTALIVGQARGVMLLLAAQHNIPVAAYTPLQIKIAITGYGRAEKSQIGHMVKILLNLPAIPKPDDTADALAIALAHAFTVK